MDSSVRRPGRKTVSPNPVVVRRGETGRLVVLLPYSPERLAKIKTVPGRRWHGPEKYWSVPNENGMPARLLALFEEDGIELSADLRAASAPSAAPLVRQHLT